MNTDYQKLFDVAEAGYSQVWLPLAGLLFVAVGFLFVIGRHWLRPSILRGVPALVVGFGIIWTITALVLTLPPYIRLRSALHDGHCTVTEGVITQFEQMPESGHGFESFVVSGKVFKYSDYILSPGFHRTHLRGSPLRDGLYVRIYHVENDIARLEIARSSNANSSEHVEVPK